MARPGWRGAILAAGLALLPAAGRAAPADPYQAALATAGREAAAGRPGEAAEALAGAVAEWPQDYPLRVARAWYLLRAGRYPEAAEGYQEALALSPGSEEAHLGLDAARAGRGAPTQWWAGLHGAGTGWSGHPSRRSLGAAALTLDAVLQDRWTLGLTWRGMAAPAGSSGRGAGSGAGRSPIAQEWQAVLGLSAPRWSLSVHGAAAARSAVTAAGAETIYGLGGAGGALAGTLRLGLTWRASAAWIAWEDRASTQVEATAALPLGHHLSLQAGWRGQRLDGAISGAALAGLAWSGGPWSASLRAEAGHQHRPWDLQGRALYNLPEPLLAALRLEGTFPLGGPVRGWLGGDLERWRPEGADATATRLGGGLTFSF